MDLEQAQFILCGRAQKALDNLPGSALLEDSLKAITTLRKEFSMEEAAAIMEVAQARSRALRQKKYSNAASMFFTRDGLEQASGELIAAHRAARLTEHLGKGARLADLCCGIGGDTTMLSRNLSVLGIELDEARLLFAGANAAVCGNAERFDGKLASVLDFSPVKAGVKAAFFDPGRRTKEGKRIYNPHDYNPPLSSLAKWIDELPGGLAVKVAPGIDYERLSQPPFCEMEIEIVSDNGEVKEAVLWLGSLKRVGRRATLINSKAESPGFLNFDDSMGVPPLPTGLPRAYLHEPDGALIRSGLLELLGPELDACKIDDDIAYLTSDRPSRSAAAHSFAIIEYFPFNLKRLKEKLRLLNTGRVTIKKRGSPLKVEELEKSLNLKGDGEEITLVLTKLAGEHTVFLTKAINN